MNQRLPLWVEERTCACGGEFVAVTSMGFATLHGMGAVLFFSKDSIPNRPGKSEYRPEDRCYATANFVACGTCGALHAFEIPMEYEPRDPKKWWWQR